MAGKDEESAEKVSETDSDYDSDEVMQHNTVYDNTT